MSYAPCLLYLYNNNNSSRYCGRCLCVAAAVVAAAPALYQGHAATNVVAKIAILINQAPVKEGEEEEEETNLDGKGINWPQTRGDLEFF